MIHHDGGPDRLDGAPSDGWLANPFIDLITDDPDHPAINVAIAIVDNAAELADMTIQQRQGMADLIELAMINPASAASILGITSDSLTTPTRPR